MAETIARIPLADLVTSLSEAVDTMCPAVANHHMQVAYISHEIALTLGWTPSDCRDVAVAGGLHDLGAFSVQERHDLLRFEAQTPHQHSRAGHRLLEVFAPFGSSARMVRFHHVPWADGAGQAFRGEETPLGSHVLHLADRVAVLIDQDKPILAQAKAIEERIRDKSGRLFHPDLVDAFMELADKDYFWFDASRDPAEVLRVRTQWDSLALDMAGLHQLGDLFRRMIDFRSQFTATHSSGVASCATELARRCGFSERECDLMEIAACFHDLGKIAVPREIVEKPGPLSDYEYSVMRSHVYYAYRILEPMKDLQLLRDWGALHQERLDGTGYPFGKREKDLPFGAQIMAVADVFTALTEDRPYRAGLAENKTKDILTQQAEHGKLNKDVVNMVVSNASAFNELRARAQADALNDYHQFMAALNT